MGTEEKWSSRMFLLHAMHIGVFIHNIWRRRCWQRTVLVMDEQNIKCDRVDPMDGYLLRLLCDVTVIHGEEKGDSPV